MNKKILSRAEVGEASAYIVDDEYGISLEYRKSDKCHMNIISIDDDTMGAIASAILAYSRNLSDIADAIIEHKLNKETGKVGD